jgi:hypothetical protein
MTMIHETFRRKSRLGCAVAAMVAISAPALAQTDKERELEARIEQLERQIHQSADSGPTATSSALAGTRFSIDGYVKLDAQWSDYRDGEIADSGAGRDSYLPAAIPVGGEPEGVDLETDIKQSRLGFGTQTDLPDGRSIASRIEVDLYGAALGNQTFANSYGMQLRHAYVSYGSWLVGQTWSNFQDVDALPDSTDFIGPTDGTVFVRQPQLRYTRGGLAISIENPETTITTHGGVAHISSDDNNVPDLAVSQRFVHGAGYLRTAILARQLRYETSGLGATSHMQYAMAASMSGMITFGRDDVRFMLTSGEGIGRYVGLGFADDAVLSARGELEAISGTAAFVAYRHVWTDKIRSTVMASGSEYRNDVALTGPNANKGSFSWAVNAFYAPIPQLDLGVEWRQASREIESGEEGTMNRLQVSAKYSF